MDYKEDGNLREWLQSRNSNLSLESKLEKLENIALGLMTIHKRNLIHCDFHSGNILNNGSGYYKGCITDLGLCRPVNYQKQEGQIFGVLPYVAPEVLQGQPYTQASDIYGFGIIAYELLANAYPYPKMDDMELASKVCGKEKPLRPNIDKVPIPQLLKDLITRCWEANPENRLSIRKLWETINNWYCGIRDGYKKNTKFYQQYLKIEEKYNTFSKTTPYQIHDNAVLCSKMIDTKQINELLKTNKQFYNSKNIDLVIDDFNLDELNIQEQSSSVQIQIPPK